jgi:signal transduction histidine kinase
MQRIVDELLDLSRIESGGWIPRPGSVDVGEIAADVITANAAAAERQHIAVEARIPAGARAVYADRTALRQILGNLVENSIRHTSAGSVIVFASRDDDGWTTVGVRDTGSGIEAEHLPRIFERFYRADAARSRESGGTGLGLSIVKHLVEAHGGHVRAESAVGRGTTITASFPPAPNGEASGAATRDVPAA